MLLKLRIKLKGSKDGKKRAIYQIWATYDFTHSVWSTWAWAWSSFAGKVSDITSSTKSDKCIIYYVITHTIKWE